MDETSYLEFDDPEETMNQEQEICSNMIDELSRQLRTYFKLKSAVVRTRFLINPASFLPTEKIIISANKNSFIEQSIHFVKNLNRLPPLGENIEKRLQVLVVKALNPNNTAQRGFLMEIKKLMKILFQELHIYSEKEPLNDIVFLEEACKMGALLCEVKRFLNVQLSEYFSELAKCYNRLSCEMVEIRCQEILIDKNIKKKEKIGLKLRI